MLKEAKLLSEEILSRQSRKSGESYYAHAESVICHLKECNVQDEYTMAAAYLYHIYDFEPNAYNLISEKVDKRVADITKGYEKLSKSSLSLIQASNDNRHLIKAILNLVEEPRVLILRLADRVENVKTAHFLESEEARVAAERALFVYAPLAHILGLKYFSGQLENNGFKIINPERFFQIEEYLNSRREEIESTFEEIKAFLYDILLENGLENIQIAHRMKHVYSVHLKALSKRRSIEEVYDLAAMRVIVNTIEDCYLVEDILKKIWDCDESNRDDYINNPKPNGYKSIHDVFQTSDNLIIEVQIRTHQMHDFNEYGQASHAIYKLGTHFRKKLQENPDWLKDVNFEKTGVDIKTNQFGKYVYAFTPKGDIKELPKGANLVDFAYAIHDQIGHNAMGGLVNGKYEGLTYEVQNGDVIKIKTTNKNPSSDWIKLVKTRKARDSIRRKLAED